eukprot:GFKZ01007976.1.p1 GENE.GFKZ01007976.1~~GFKZ01007976.1.p1  ORF type:complete len:161 (-),score=7.54 GFKZ01007976.1:264-746(-)
MNDWVAGTRFVGTGVGLNEGLYQQSGFTQKGAPVTQVHQGGHVFDGSIDISKPCPSDLFGNLCAAAVHMVTRSSSASLSFAIEPLVSSQSSGTNPGSGRSHDPSAAAMQQSSVNWSFAELLITWYVLFACIPSSLIHLPSPVRDGQHRRTMRTLFQIALP